VGGPRTIPEKRKLLVKLGKDASERGDNAIGCVCFLVYLGLSGI
jgi:hypothetical protein